MEFWFLKLGASTTTTNSGKDFKQQAELGMAADRSFKEATKLDEQNLPKKILGNMVENLCLDPRCGPQTQCLAALVLWAKHIQSCWMCSVFQFALRLDLATRSQPRGKFWNNFQSS